MPKGLKSKSLDGVVAAVTGGGRGIGLACAQELASRGAVVAILGRNEERLKLAEETLVKSFGKRFFATQIDVADPGSVADAFSRVKSKVGAIQILVNNAGVGVSSPFQKLSLDSWNQILEINLTGTFLCTHEVLPSMMDAKFGRIVNMSSTAGVKGYKYVTAYTAAKHGIVGLTRSLALEVASSGITVNAVCPGFTETDLLSESVAKAASKTGRKVDEIRKEFLSSNPQGHFIKPEDVASTVAWLCEAEQGSINGQAIVISGGEV